jgi:subtilisin family serine protease
MRQATRQRRAGRALEDRVGCTRSARRPAAGRARVTFWAIGGIFSAAGLIASPPLPAEAGAIQAPIQRRIAADSLGALGFPGSAKALLRGAEPAVGLDGRITVQVTLHPRASDAGRTDGTDGASGEIIPLVGDAPPAWLASIPGCAVRGSFGPCVEVRIPPAQVRALSAHPEVLYLGLSPRPLPLVESQGLAGMRVPQFWSRFHEGDGVRVGILDVGFARYEQRLGSELPAHVVAHSFYDAGSGPDITGGNVDHGTACAEIVHDVAPGAELYLVNAGTVEEMRQAVTWLVEQGVEVISHSIAWPLGGGDGTGPIHDLVRLARDNGVTWVNASGNFAQGHWSGRWRDANQDRILDVDSLGNQAILLPAGGGGSDISAWLTWDRWPFSTDLEFEIELIAADGRTILASSQNDWSDYPYAFRPLDLANANLAGATIRVRCIRGTPEGRFLQVTRTDNGDLAPESRVPAGSIAMPADSPDAIAVGAYSWSDGSLESYSSYGPTLDGRAKPEILGPDGVETSVLSGPFRGTSAACPHVAGAIALLLGAGPRGGLFDARPDAAQVKGFLRREAAPLDHPAPAGSTGWGRARLPEDRTDPEAPQLLALGNGSGPPVLRLERAAGSPGSCEVFDLQGRLVARLAGGAKSNGAVEFQSTPLASLHLVRGRYWAREPLTGTCVSFLWPGRAAH